MGCHGLRQHRLQVLIHFHSQHLFCPEAQLLGQGAHTGTDFQHAAGIIHTGFFRDLLGHPCLCQEVLALGLGKMKPITGKNIFDYLNIGQFHHGTSAFLSMLSYHKTPPAVKTCCEGNMELFTI